MCSSSGSTAGPDRGCFLPAMYPHNLDKVCVPPRTLLRSEDNLLESGLSYHMGPGTKHRFQGLGPRARPSEHLGLLPAFLLPSLLSFIHSSRFILLFIVTRSPPPTSSLNSLLTKDDLVPWIPTPALSECGYVCVCLSSVCLS